MDARTVFPGRVSYPGAPLPRWWQIVVTLDEVVVTDSFGDDWTLTPPADGWSMFATTRLGRESLVVWAVGQRLHGRDLPTPDDPPPEPPAVLDASGRQGYAYRAATRIPPHWHPYVVQEVGGRRRFVQGRAADLSGPTAALLPAAESDLLQDPASGGVHPVHQVEPAAIPTEGVRLERRAVLARRTDASPVLWMQRRRLPLLTPPALRVRFDALEPVPPAV